MSDEPDLIIPLPGERLTDKPVEEALARAVTAPEWNEGNKMFLLWPQIQGDIDADEPDIEMMFWTPETEDEWADANRLFELTHPRPWKDISELEKRIETASNKGGWLVRWVLQWNSWNFLMPLGFQELIDSGSINEDAEVYSRDPGEAAVMGEREALEAVIALSRQEELEENVSSYYDAIPNSRANMSNYPNGHVNF